MKITLDSEDFTFKVKEDKNVYLNNNVAAEYGRPMKTGHIKTLA